MENILKHSQSNTDVKESLKRGGSIKYWLFSFAVNAVILVIVMHFSELMYETNDDYSISCKIVSLDFSFIHHH